ncbi:AlpA family phage regulatory protein [Agrobacterium sp. lyk4-40-TYG-31]|uniref:helix-turn-helix transcriptional regulator n=1 Tax=Agrobacterium sp. lyk4-40-TYG-31 TaxID=3040276 RepID=UPI00254CD837|nr:AlpA family phage regulatory protein [Agrobacterium sp. lyk4-40-TYG-31]
MNELLKSHRFYRLKDILAPNGPIPISKSSWYNKVRSGEFPQPVKLGGPRSSAYRARDIDDLIRRFEEEGRDA